MGSSDQFTPKVEITPKVESEDEYWFCIEILMSKREALNRLTFYLGEASVSKGIRREINALPSVNDIGLAGCGNYSRLDHGQRTIILRDIERIMLRLRDLLV